MVQRINQKKKTISFLNKFIISKHYKNKWNGELMMKILKIFIGVIFFAISGVVAKEGLGIDLSSFINFLMYFGLLLSFMIGYQFFSSAMNNE